MKPITFIDLFCGCGGFSLGMRRAGFLPLAAIDFNPEAVQVFKKNFADVPLALERDLTKFGPEKLEALLEGKTVDVVVGGPPCQGFSTVRQRDGANNGPRMVEDGRRHLYEEFLRYVGHFKPKVFVMENVLGIRSADGGKYFRSVQREAREIGYRVHSKIEKAYELGVPQKRQRQLIIGTRLDLPDYFYGDLKPAPRAMEHPSLGDAIGDLPTIRAGGGEDEREYDLERRKAYLKQYSGDYLTKTLEVDLAEKLTAHKARPHSARDLRDFEKLKEGEHCAAAMKRGVTFEFPYDRGSFKDRYTRQHHNKPCSTIVAHLSKDGLMFIHPTQTRSLTPREAARVQSFPDWFQFPIARTHQFRVIGNAVPPLVSEAVGIAVKSYLEKAMGSKKRPARSSKAKVPAREEEAVTSIEALVAAAQNKSIREMPTRDFLRGWFSVGFLFSGLHPDGALEHGGETSNHVDGAAGLTPRTQRLCVPFYTQSGWPVSLAPVADEAWRRYEAGDIEDDDFYCAQAVAAGMRHRDPTLAGEPEWAREEIPA
jgi:DNA (cytosine-5)-methyltransferase 1